MVPAPCGERACGLESMRALPTSLLYFWFLVFGFWLTGSARTQDDVRRVRTAPGKVLGLTIGSRLAGRALTRSSPASSGAKGQGRGGGRGEGRSRGDTTLSDRSERGSPPCSKGSIRVLDSFAVSPLARPPARPPVESELRMRAALLPPARPPVESELRMRAALLLHRMAPLDGDREPGSLSTFAGCEELLVGSWRDARGRSGREAKRSARAIGAKDDRCARRIEARGGSRREDDRSARTIRARGRSEREDDRSGSGGSGRSTGALGFAAGREPVRQGRL